MNLKNRFVGGVILSLIMLGAASAGYQDYEVDWMVLPGTIYENTDVTIFGYISIDDLGGILPINNFTLRVMEGSTVKKQLKLTDTALSYVNDYDNDELLLDGFFYTKMSDLDEGVYSAIISIGGEDVDYQSFEVNSGESNLSANLITITTNNGPVIDLDYTGGTPIVNAELYLYGRENFDNPTVVSASGITNGTTYHVDEVSGFELSDYVDDNQVYGFVVYGVTSDGNPSEPEIIVKNTGFKDIVYDAGASLETKALKKGKAESLSLSIENNGSLLTSYEVGLSGSLSDYASVDDGFELMPGDLVTKSLIIDLPRSHVPLTGNLTVTLTAGGSVVDEQTYFMNLSAADPIHSVSVNSVTFSEDYYFEGEYVKGNISITNDGDYTEYVDVKYYFNNQAVGKTNQVSLARGETKNITIFSQAGSESTLVVTATNGNLDYVESFDVNIVNKDYEFNFYLEDSEIISQNAVTETAELVIENTGNVDDVFLVTSGYGNVELNNSGKNTISVIVPPEESVVIDAEVNIPSDELMVNSTFTVCSQMGNECSEADLLISIFRSADDIQGSESVVNISETSLTGDTEEGVIYSFDVTNNRLISKNYEVVYETNATGLEFSVYPGVNFTVQPGETQKVFLYATPSEAGDYDINYIIKEEGVELASGDLELNAGSSVDGITGFAVAAGGVLGVAGLVVLVLFIYFYFIRQPSSTDDDFKPVEVKKADLTKPATKNDDKYW
ncbi:hypothetical protein GF352_04760 [archaeon]|nr:hypothetical protein [archaeon]